VPKKINVEIKESVEFLKIKLNHSKGKANRDRIKTLIYIKEEKFHFQSEIGKVLRRTDKTIRTWLQEYHKNGFNGILGIKNGGNNAHTISDKAIKLISKKVKHPNDSFSSFMELKKILEKELDEIINYQALYSHCRRNHKNEFKSLRDLMKGKRGIKGISPRNNKQISKDFC